MEKNELLTNKSAGALLRDAELELVKRREDYAVELSWIDPSAWDKFLGCDVTIPRIVKLVCYAGGTFNPGRQLTTEEIHLLEETVERWHGVTLPYHISMSITLQKTGHPWAYIPEAGVFLTGFTLGKE